MDKKVIAFDIDGTLLTLPTNDEPGVEKYKTCQPIPWAINLCNTFRVNHYVKIYTSRGMTQYKGDVKKIEEELRNFTEEQLREFGINYDELIFGKEHFDLLIDDKAVNAKLGLKAVLKQYWSK